MMKAIPGVMDLAAAGQIGAGEAANLRRRRSIPLASKRQSLLRLADLLAAAANASTADNSDLAFAYRMPVPSLPHPGKRPDLATMMALLANNGLNASDAATSLKTMTLRLTAPTAQAAKEMKRLGINVFNADGSMRDYHDIIVDLTKASSGLRTSSGRWPLAPSSAPLTCAANILVKEGQRATRRWRLPWASSSAEAANAQNKGLAGAMQSIMGTIESLQIKLATPFEPQITAWTDQVNGFIKSLGDLPQPVINAALAFGAFAVALGAVLLAGAGIGKVLEIFTATKQLRPSVDFARPVSIAAAAAILWAAANEPRLFRVRALLPRR
jgi:TP901 family phage tail tape measure protein